MHLRESSGSIYGVDDVLESGVRQGVDRRGFLAGCAFRDLGTTKVIEVRRPA